MSYSRKGKRGNKDMKVIFLDVDGVLNSQQLFEKSEDAQLISVDEENIKNLKKIVDATGAKIVLSSSWRYGWAEHSDAVQDWCQILVDILAKYDLKIIDKTEYLSSGRREDEIKEHLKEAKNIKDYIKYVCVGNYIDFGVTGNIDDQMLDDLLKKVDSLNIPEQEIKYLEEELKQAKTLLYITDNCGEIVLDKIFIEELKKRYGNLEITVMVRGGLAINDATIEDAQEIGLTKIVPVISNGAAIAGTVKEQLSKEARKQLDSADVIIAKGMGNFESMYQEGINPYYLFLCKCDLFTRRFGVKLFDPIFCKEERLDIK